MKPVIRKTRGHGRKSALLRDGDLDENDRDGLQEYGSSEGTMDFEEFAH